MAKVATAAIGNRVPLGMQVADALREQIRAQALAEGDELLSEAKLAEQFAVSGRVIRDALRNLDNQGVIRTRQGKRAIVAGLRPVAVQNYFKIAIESDALSVEELLELRPPLRAAELAAERATDKQIRDLRRLLLELEASGTKLDERVPIDIALHDVVAEASGNRFFSGILHSLSHALSEERRAGGELRQASGSDHTDSTRMHARLVGAIAAHDPVAAGAAAREIITSALTEFNNCQHR